MKTELLNLSDQILGAVVTGVYQSVLVTLLVAFGMRFWRRANAASRHAVWFLVLLLVGALVPAHFILGRLVLRSGAAEIAAARGRNPGTVLTEAGNPPWRPQAPPAPGEVEPLPADGDFNEASGWLPDAMASDTVSRLDARVPTTGGASGDFAGPEPAKSRWTAFGRECAELLQAGPGLLRPAPLSFGSVLGVPVAAAIVLLLVTVAATRVSLLVWRCRRLCDLARYSTTPGEEVRTLFDRLRCEGGVRRKVQLRVSPNQPSALALGFIRPAVLLPKEMAATGPSSDLAHVLRHELAHIRRFDDWANLLQHVVAAIFFFNPAISWIARRLALEREIACDDHVLEQGGSPRQYAMVLANFAGRLQRQSSLPAPGVSTNRSQLQQRISMILNTRRNSSPRLAKAGLASMASLAGLVCGLVVYSTPRLVLASSTAAEASPSNAGPDPNMVAAPAPNGLTPTSVAPLVIAQAGVDPGPKFKPESPDSPALAEPPEMPEPPADEMQPPGMPKPRVARVGKPPRAPQPLEMGDANGDRSIEERLRKLEKMVHALMDQQNSKRQWAFNYDQDEKRNFNLNQKQLDKMKQMAEREASRAAEQAQRAEDQARRATKEMGARIEQQKAGKDAREGLRRQLDALREAREGLGREMERLDREIQKLERDQDRGDNDQPKRRSEINSNRMQASVSTSTSVLTAPEVSVSAPEVSVSASVGK